MPLLYRHNDRYFRHHSKNIHATQEKNGKEYSRNNRKIAHAYFSLVDFWEKV